MVVKQNKMYKAIVVSIVEDTLNLVVRVPILHSGLKDKDLPVAIPMTIPGLTIDKTEFNTYITTNPWVYVWFESNDMTKPMYLVAVGER